MVKYILIGFSLLVACFDIQAGYLTCATQCSQYLLQHPNDQITIAKLHKEGSHGDKIIRQQSVQTRDASDGCYKACKKVCGSSLQQSIFHFVLLPKKGKIVRMIKCV